MSSNLPLIVGALALAAPAPGQALTASTILEDAGPALIENRTQAELDRARGEIERAQDEIERAHAALASMSEDSDLAEQPEPPEPPEPPEAPEAPELPEVGHLPDIDALVNGAMAQVHSALGGPFGGGSGLPLVVASELDAAKHGELQEDLTVMGRILVKAATKVAGGDRNRVALGIRLQMPFGQSGPSSLYLEGYGAVFFLNVNYPLVAPPARSEPKVEPEKPIDTTWEEARAEVYGGGQARRSTGAMLAAGASANQLAYDAARVDSLRTALLGVAKNAANIRHVKPDEQVLIVVQGSGQPMPKPSGRRAAGPGALGTTSGTRASAATTLLSLRIKKADADAAAQGKLGPEEFAKKAALSAY